MVAFYRCPLNSPSCVRTIAGSRRPIHESCLRRLVPRRCRQRQRIRHRGITRKRKRARHTFRIAGSRPPPLISETLEPWSIGCQCRWNLRPCRFRDRSPLNLVAEYSQIPRIDVEGITFHHQSPRCRPQTPQERHQTSSANSRQTSPAS